MAGPGAGSPANVDRPPSFEERAPPTRAPAAAVREGLPRISAGARCVAPPAVWAERPGGDGPSALACRHPHGEGGPIGGAELHDAQILSRPMLLWFLAVVALALSPQVHRIASGGGSLLGIPRILVDFFGTGTLAAASVVVAYLLDAPRGRP